MKHELMIERALESGFLVYEKATTMIHRQDTKRSNTDVRETWKGVTRESEKGERYIDTIFSQVT